MKASCFLGSSNAPGDPLALLTDAHAPGILCRVGRAVAQQGCKLHTANPRLSLQLVTHIIIKPY